MMFEHGKIAWFASSDSTTFCDAIDRKCAYLVCPLGEFAFGLVSGVPMVKGCDLLGPKLNSLPSFFYIYILQMLFWSGK